MFHHDRQIVINTARAALAGWQDRLIAGTVLLVALAVIRAWFADRSWTVAAWSALAAGVMVGAGAGRLVATRLAFHSFDGVLAIDALHPPARRQYQVAWHGIGLSVLGATTLIARPSLLIVSLPAYLTGASVVVLTRGLSVRGTMAMRFRPVRAIRPWLNGPIAGAAAATVLLLSLLPARAAGTDAVMVMVGTETVLLAVTLTIVDDTIVRFMTVTGHGPGRIVAYHGKSMASFTGVAVPGCWIALGPVAAAIVAAASIAMFLLLTLRVLAYMLHGKRSADLLVSILAGLLMLVGYLVPVALPVFVIALVWHFQRRGSAKRWLLA